MSFLVRFRPPTDVGVAALSVTLKQRYKRIGHNLTGKKHNKRKQISMNGWMDGSWMDG